LNGGYNTSIQHKQQIARDDKTGGSMI